MVHSIVAENVSKYFTLRYHRTFKEVTVAKLRGQQTGDTFKAIDDVSFTVEQGESIGLMGLNGSGKSTLLKMINGVMRPDEGSVLTRGRIAGLIATGAGFHPQLTGRENLYLNAAILGMTEREIARKFDDIVEFAELGRTLDGPVGHYSSGQKARLGFAIAVHVDSDIFLADEVLAVGDKPFKVKCMARMREIRDSGRTLFYVSHSAASVKKMCDRVIVLDQGKLAFDGATADGIRFLEYGAANDEDEVADEEIGNDV
ncbi:ABC transporter ATP-binding protein [Nocardioides sp. zg-ZUI104]|uniref:ABC transporter ATP-binding protein n=1 Tax=Nocardioides faecalis TaxID=2803858 RepID=UPI001BCE6994|nr:ABC transporter ATP-binding protein [Nocardioides faecalis]MBS4751570.1 ABC transporter ATP-binding protein [Nocardioides faecalis]